MNKPVQILHLENSPRDAELVRNKLHQGGIVCVLRIASNRAEYEAALVKTRFDLVLSDYSLTDYDGMAALALAREMQPGVPFILVTGTLDDEQALDCVLRGATDYVLKRRLELLVPVALRALKEADERENRRQSDVALRQSAVDLRALAARLHAIREDERKSLARELHDNLGQNLTALQIDLAWLDRRMGSATPPDLVVLRDKTAAMMRLAEQLTELTQTISSSLRLGVLDDLGLVAAIEWQAADFEKRTGLACAALVPAEDVVLDPDRALALYRILQEALTNVTRHAQATHVDIRLRSVGGELDLEIQDNGRGFIPGPFAGTKALGLLGMRERAALLGGSVDVSSEPGKGTTVRVRVPAR
jgi:signal transduction histidine kinase